ncbi:MAG: hypothetical protein R6V75_00540 [Bacteroidales bacterium]
MRPLLLPFTSILLLLSLGFVQTANNQSLARPVATEPEFTWKTGVGYEYLLIIQPDTGRGTFRGLHFNLDRAVARKIWIGSGLVAGRTDLGEFTKVRIIDHSIVDSLGFFLMRDSIVSEHRWQNHLALPLRMTVDLARGTLWSIPLSLGTTIGVVYNKGSINQYGDITRIARQSSPDGFTGFITADLGLGYQVFQLERLSVMLSAEARYVIAGRKSFGYRHPFVGGKALVNFYW